MSLKTDLKHPLAWLLGFVLLSAALTGCSNGDDDRQAQAAPYTWSRVVHSPDAALLSIHGTSATNVYAVGADGGDGPIVIHWDGNDWTKINTGLTGDLWWVNACLLYTSPSPRDRG